jgi:hypothetical protein
LKRDFPGVTGRHRTRMGILDHPDTFVNQATLKKFSHISIFSWQKLIATLDDRHLHAKAAERLREFATDRSAPRTIMFSGFSLN